MTRPAPPAATFSGPQPPFMLSIEPVDGATFLNPFHLGTDETVARREAEDRFHGRNKHGLPTRSVALIRARRVFDVYDGRWSSQLWDDHEPEDQVTIGTKQPASRQDAGKPQDAR